MPETNIEGHANPVSLYLHTGYTGLGRKQWQSAPVSISVAENITDTDKKYYNYDSAGHMDNVILSELAGGQSPEYEYFYDPYGNLAGIRDAESRLTVFKYDHLNRQTHKYMPFVYTGALGDHTDIYAIDLSGYDFEQTEYDSYGRIKVHFDYIGQATEYIYGDLGRLQYRRYYQADDYPNTVTDEYEYTYDILGRQDVIYKNSALEQDFNYDEEGRVIRIESPQGTINYDYSTITGRKIRTWTGDIYANAVSVTEYGYDNLGRLDRVTVTKRNGITVDESTRYTYNEVGSLKSIEYPNGNYTYHWYNARNQLTKLTNFAQYETDPDNPAGSVLSSFEYSLAADGQRLQAVETSSGTSRTVQWHYDSLNRLVEESIVSGYTHLYEYDLAGNRESVTKDGITTYYFYDECDRLLKECSDANGLNILIQYGYDTNGSITSKVVTGGDTTTYTYNLQNRLESVTAGSNPTVTYQYNPSGIRTQKSIAGGDTIDYLIDSANYTGYAQVLEQTVSDGVNPDSVTFFILGSDIIGQAVDSSTPMYFLYDGHGSVRQDADNTGTAQQSYDYDAYGNADGFTPSNGLYYCGEMYDSVIGGYNLRTRDYRPDIGMFMTRDTYPGNRYDPPSLHKYLYVHANPINNYDPTGQFSISEMSVNLAIQSIGMQIVSPLIKPAESIFTEGLMKGLLPADIVQQLSNFPSSFSAFMFGGSLSGIASKGVAVGFGGGLEVLYSPFTNTTGLYGYSEWVVGATKATSGVMGVAKVGMVFNTSDLGAYEGNSRSVTIPCRALPSNVREAIIKKFAAAPWEIMKMPKMNKLQAELKHFYKRAKILPKMIDGSTQISIFYTPGSNGSWGVSISKIYLPGNAGLFAFSMQNYSLILGDRDAKLR